MSEASGSPLTVLILGIGNILWADEGFGVRALEALQRHYEFDDNVRLLDGGTQGIYLVQEIREADVVVVFDAVDYHLPPGTLKQVEGDDVPKFLGVKKVSLHQTGFQEVLALAEMMGDYPAHLYLIGVQPEVLDDYGGSLSDSVKRQIQPAHQLALTYLARLGVEGRRRPTALRADTSAAGAIADIDTYESGRPTADRALRLGDDRVVLSEDFEVAYQPVDVDGVAVTLDHHLDQYRK